ncbi:MAG: acyltransferase family protein [Acutalibacteraceae bacterium]
MQQTNLCTAQQNYNFLDLVRFICALLVVTIHVEPFGLAETTSLFGYLNFGIQNYLARIAVPFFFVASGFFLYKKTTLPEFDTAPTKKYVVRLLKLYLIWTIIYLPLAFLSLLKEGWGLKHAVPVYIRNVIFAGSYMHLWYLPSLIVAVIIVSFLLYKKVNVKKIIILSSVLYFIGLFAQSWFGFITPLEELAPSLWNILRLVQSVIYSTRNGLFEGFVFVAIGMCFAFYDFNIKKGKAFAGFAVSMVLLLFEVFILQRFELSRAHDMYLFLVPAAFFGFSFILNVKLPDNAIYKSLRVMSYLIFYMHPLINKAVTETLKCIDTRLSESGVKFLITLTLTIALSYLIMKLSEKPKLRFLKKLYS